MLSLSLRDECREILWSYHSSAVGWRTANGRRRTRTSPIRWAVAQLQWDLVINFSNGLVCYTPQGFFYYNRNLKTVQESGILISRRKDHKNLMPSIIVPLVSWDFLTTTIWAAALQMSDHVHNWHKLYWCMSYCCHFCIQVSLSTLLLPSSLCFRETEDENLESQVNKWCFGKGVGLLCPHMHAGALCTKFLPLKGGG